MAHFINASIAIILEEGLNGLTIRKIADRADYNSATLYHYFSSFEELCIFACLKFVDEYAKDLPTYLSQASRPLDKYFKIWECFCKHSFHRPEEFWLLFFKSMPDVPDLTYYFKEYYVIFPENWSDDVLEYQSMLTTDSLFEREYISLTKSLTKEGLTISEEMVHKITEMNILIYRGMLSFMRENPGRFTPEQATEKTMEYLRHTLYSYGII
jgi:AcrR family transcriptional regulator